MSEEQNKALMEWSTLSHLLCISEGQYSIVEHVKRLFNYRDFPEISYLIRGGEVDTEFRDRGDRALYYAKEITRGLVVKTLSLKRMDALNLLEDDKVSERLRFYSLLELSFLFHGCYVLKDFATNSDFWRCVESAQIDDHTFLSFHVFHYTYQMGKKLTDTGNYSSNIDGALSMSKAGNIYSEAKILKTREYMDAFLSKLRELLLGPLFNNQYLAFYEHYGALAKTVEPNPCPEGLLPYLLKALSSNWPGATPLAVVKLNELTRAA